MRKDCKQPKKRAKQANSNEENLQTQKKVHNFATTKYINPMTDFGFKKIFGVEEIMKAFLNDLIQPEHPILKVIFLDKEMLPERYEQRGVIYDLLCTTEDGEEFIVEMQNAPQPRFAERAVFYICRKIGQQGHKGKQIDNRDWDFRLHKVYGIYLINFHLRDNQRVKIRTIQLTVKEQDHEVFDDNFNAFVIELPCMEGMKEADCKTNIERWMYNLYIMEMTNQPLAFRDVMPVFERVATQAEFNNMSYTEQEQYINALNNYRSNKAAWDYSLQKGLQKGFQQGMEKGLEQGMQKGRMEGKIEGARNATLINAKSLKEKNIPVAIIAEALGLSIEEIEKL